MDFQVGDEVIHRIFGLGEIVKLDEKVLSGHKDRYYVVKVRDLTLWVPINNDDENCSLRLPTPGSEFKRIFAILRSPAEPLADNRFERKKQLLERMRDGTLESICRVIRDLTFHRSVKKLNEDDHNILERAQNFLLNEWKFSLLVPLSQAEQELSQLLSGTRNRK